MRKIEDLTVTVVGLGVIGGAFAECFMKMGVKSVFGIDIDEKTIDKAKKRGIITEGYVKTKEVLKKSDLVVITLYPNIMKSFFINNLENFKENAIITDVVGIKKKIIEDIKPLLKKSNKNLDFIFGHPMAGREKRGIDYADSTVFNNANYILIKNEKNKKENIKLFEDIIKKMGFKTISYLTEKEHDEIIAFTSQLTHAIAVSLINSDTEKFDTKRYIGDSYRDLTRIAKINEDLWSELFLGNKENLLNMIKNFEVELDIVKNALKSDDIGILKEKFINSTRRRELLENND